MRHGEREVRLWLVLLTAVARTNPAEVSLIDRVSSCSLFVVQHTMEWSREKSPPPKEWEWEKGRWVRVVGESQKLGVDCGRAYNIVCRKNQLYGFIRSMP
jgi:hypothetical protein